MHLIKEHIPPIRFHAGLCGAAGRTEPPVFAARHTSKVLAPRPDSQDFGVMVTVPDPKKLTRWLELFISNGCCPRIALSQFTPHSSDCPGSPYRSEHTSTSGRASRRQRPQRGRAAQDDFTSVRSKQDLAAIKHLASLSPECVANSSRKTCAKVSALPVTALAPDIACSPLPSACYHPFGRPAALLRPTRLRSSPNSAHGRSRALVSGACSCQIGKTGNAH